MPRISPIARFQQRFIVPMIGLLAVMLMYLCWNTVQQLSQDLGADLQRKGVRVIQNLARMSSEPLASHNRRRLFQLVRLSQQSDGDCQGVALFNADGRMVATTNTSLALPSNLSAAGPFQSLKEFPMGDSVLLVYPIIDKTNRYQGTALLDLSKEHLFQIVHQSASQLILTTLGVFVLVAFFLQRLLNRLKVLADAEFRKAADLEAAYKNLQGLQSQLLRSEKLAAVGQLASSVGHELRNPLGAIKNSLYYIRDTLKDHALAKEDPNLMEFMDLADEEIKSATRIITDLLDFSRDVTLLVKPTDLRAELAHVKSTLEIPPNVHWIEEYPSNLPLARLDPEKMRQVFVNLAGNAIQSMTKGGDLHVTTRLEKESADHSPPWVEVEFKDTGEGMAPDLLEKIFEPLFTTKARGTGLGLPICQGIVQAHGGRILVQSEPGRGSTFTVRFPLEVNHHGNRSSP